jgi:hypothetical protein
MQPGTGWMAPVHRISTAALHAVGVEFGALGHPVSARAQTSLTVISHVTLPAVVTVKLPKTVCDRHSDKLWSVVTNKPEVLPVILLALTLLTWQLVGTNLRVPVSG